MSKQRVILGIDTSNYTTSVALLSTGGELIANIKEPLPVKTGERGLRQSEAVFSHVKNLPICMNRLSEYLENREICAVGVSDKPRNQVGSYMPCFLSGVASARSIATALDVPLYTFSHQCGHIMAALFSSGRLDLCERAFAAFHISGGTTELVKITPDERGFCAELIGGTKDLNAGQIIDRIGVYMGLSFPCGAEMESLALSYEGKPRKVKASLDGTYVNLSGLENLAIKLYNECEDKALVSRFVLDYIAAAISGMTEAYVNENGAEPIVYAGGVMCNSIIKSTLSKRFDAYFAAPEMSADNAVGIANLALRAYKKEI